jgi:hypothetical protein
MNKFAAVLVATALLVGACKQNPFSQDGKMTQREPAKAEPVFPPLVLDLPKSADALEGQKFEVAVKASVPKPGQPLLTWKGLPPGAVFNPETMKLTWAPDYQAANDPENPNTALKKYVVDFELTSTENPVVVQRESMLIVVQDVPRELKINLPAVPVPQNLQEGVPFEQIIEVSSEDFPNTAFDLQIKNLPLNVVKTRDLTQANRFKLSFVPSFRDVLIAETRSSTMLFKDVMMEVNIFGPRGISVTAPLLWRIADVRAPAVVIVPTRLTTGTSITFSVSAEDPNGETVPSLSIFPKPKFGLAELRTVTHNPGNPMRGVNPSTVADFRWAQIPPEKIGTKETVTFRACVNRDLFGKNLCSEHKVEVSFEVENHLPPVIDRSQLPLGAVEFVRLNQKLEKMVWAVDGEGASTPPSLKVVGSDEVTLTGRTLTMQFKKAGIKQFSLVATSVYGVQRMETFLVDVVPGNWGNVLVFGDGPRVPEVQAASKFFEYVQIVNPVLQLGDPRLLVLRDASYLTTSAFSEPTFLSEMEKAAASLPSVIVSTPEIGKLEGALKEELAALSVKVGTPVADLTGYTLELVDTTYFNTPTEAISFAAGKKPVEVQFTGMGSSCKNTLVLKKAGAQDIPVAVVCQRKSGGKFVAAGFEFGDIQTALTDQGIVKRWLTDLVVVKR